jgi:thiol-disulfide isomerase/thioredoxin
MKGITLKGACFSLVTLIGLIPFILTTTSCRAQQPAQEQKWVGKTEVTKLKEEFDWFANNYNTYSPDSAAIKALKGKVNSYTYYVFGGVWCGDTKRVLPKFFKTMDLANVQSGKIELFLLDHQKHSLDKEEKKYKVLNIPTFIIYKDGKEMGRIVEEEKESIEKDLLKLIQ